MNTTNDDNVNKKLSTGIPGLDALFHGGIHTHKGDDGHNGIIMLARGQHGVNKIHLAMQICEGLNNSYNNDKKGKTTISETIYEDSIVFSEYMKDEFRYKSFVIQTIEEEIKNQKDLKLSIYQEKIYNEIKDKVAVWYSDKNKEGINELNNKSYDFSFFELLKPEFQSIKEAICESNKSKIRRFFKKLRNSFLGKREENTSIKEWVQDNWNILKILNETERKRDPQILFISLNKDTNFLKNSYYDFYIQRLIRNIRNRVDVELAEKSITLLRAMLWYQDGDCRTDGKELLEQYELPSITGKKPQSKGEGDSLKKDIESGFIYYNGRTHGLHIRHQRGAEDTGGMLLCKLYVPDDYNKVQIIGNDTLNNGNTMKDGLTTFQNMVNYLYNKYNDNAVSFIMIDGLSRLTEDEIVQCPFNALSDKMRTLCKVGIVTSDEKLSPSDISVDIIIDMAIRESERSDYQYNALKISKCLYQKNAYGWHRYKMRNAGIEVIPSIHLQMGQRFLMDDMVTDAILPVNKYPYPYWLNENDTIYQDEHISNARIQYDDEFKHVLETKSLLKGFGVEKGNTSTLIQRIVEEMSENHHVLFVSLDKNRIGFNNDYIKIIESGKSSECMNNIHLFNFQSGFFHTDELLWTLDQQVQAIEKVARKKSGDRVLKTHYLHVSLVVGDLNYIHYSYPCLSSDPLLLPALAIYTKKHHMTNFVYATSNCEECVKGMENTELHKKEIETIMQMRRITDVYESIEG